MRESPEADDITIRFDCLEPDTPRHIVEACVPKLERYVGLPDAPAAAAHPDDLRGTRAHRNAALDAFATLELMTVGTMFRPNAQRELKILHARLPSAHMARFPELPLDERIRVAGQLADIAAHLLSYCRRRSGEAPFPPGGENGTML